MIHSVFAPDLDKCPPLDRVYKGCLVCQAANYHKKLLLCPLVIRMIEHYTHENKTCKPYCNCTIPAKEWSRMQYVKEKMETLEDMPGNENCIETPLSQLVQWSWLLVLRNPCIGCFA